MMGDFLLWVVDYLKRMMHDAKVFIRENTCIHDYEINYSNSVKLIKRFNKCGREKYIIKR